MRPGISWFQQTKKADDLQNLPEHITPQGLVLHHQLLFDQQ